MNGKEIIKILESAGWKHTGTRGSHFKMEKPRHRSVPVPVHGKKDLGVGLIKIIEKQTSVKLLRRN